MKQDRFLFGILIGIGLLMLLAIVLFFLRQRSVLEYGTEGSPEGVVRNYMVAVLRKEYERAYSYLADDPGKPSLIEFKKAFIRNLSAANIGVDIGATEIAGDEAYVTIYIQYQSSDPFSSGYRNQEQAVLVRQGDAWKIRQMPGYFWSWEWFQPTPAPLFTP